MSNEFFNKALSNFVTDFASGGAIRSLANKGYSIAEITDMLDFPTPKEKVAQIVWQHYLNTGKIRLTPPEESGKTEIVKYVKEQGKYGTVSMRKVVEEVTVAPKNYITCEFGKLLYQKQTAFLSRLETLSAKEKSYVVDLPWPLTPVYYETDETMERIIRKLEL